MILYGEQDIREMLDIYFQKNESKTTTAEDELDFFNLLFLTYKSILVLLLLNYMSILVNFK